MGMWSLLGEISVHGFIMMHVSATMVDTCGEMARREEQGR